MSNVDAPPIPLLLFCFSSKSTSERNSTHDTTVFLQKTVLKKITNRREAAKTFSFF